MTVTATTADHEIGRRGVDAEPIGFLVEGTRRVYFAGDTDLFDGMERARPAASTSPCCRSGAGDRRSVPAT